MKRRERQSQLFSDPRSSAFICGSISLLPQRHVMRNSTRNTLIQWTSLAAVTACAVALVWVMFHVEGRASTRWIVMLVGVAVAWAGVVAYHVSVHRAARQIDAEARAAGVDPPDE